MPTVPFRRSRLLAPLSAATALAIILTGAGAAQAQPDVTRVVKPARTAAPSAMSPYATTVTPAKAAAGEAVGSDPFEPVNRKIFLLNGALDVVVIRPLAVFWHHAAPKPIRQGINNFLSNLGEPVVFINDLLQGHPATAAGTATRFAVNSTVGLLGVIDVTGATGATAIPHHDNGFGLTLGRWGVKSGPYLVIPLLGPSTVRDGIGQGIDIAANPLTYARQTGDGGLTTGLTIIGGLDARAEADPDLKALQAMSTDIYAALRSFYLQNRQAQVMGGKIDINSLPSFDDPGTAAAPALSATPSAAATAHSTAAELSAPPADPATAPPAAPAESGAEATAEPAAAPAQAASAIDAAQPPPAAPKGV